MEQTTRLTVYPNLEAELHRSGLTRVDVATAGGFHLSTASEKLTKPNRLKICEAQRIRDGLFPEMSMDYLYSNVATVGATHKAIRRDA